jgi:chromosome segregation ATPase
MKPTKTTGQVALLQKQLREERVKLGEERREKKELETELERLDDHLVEKDEEISRLKDRYRALKALRARQLPPPRTRPQS